MKRGWLRAIALVLVALVLFGLYSFYAQLLAEHPVSWADLNAWRPDILQLAVSLLMLVGVYLMHALLWRRIMRDLGIGSPAFATTVRIYFISGLARYIPFVRMVQLAGLAVLSKRAGLPPGSAAAASVLGQIGFLTTAMLVLGATLPEWLGRLGGRSEMSAGLTIAVATAILIVGAASVWVLVATPVGHGFRAAVVRRLGGRAGEKIAAAFQLADRIRPRDAALWAAGYALSWILLGFAFVVFAGSFYPESWNHVRLVAGTVAAAYLAGYFAFILPAGLGAREAAMIALLLQIDMPFAAAVVITVASRVWFTVAELAPLTLLPLMKSPPALEREVG